jgi:hypothetical protein
VQTLPFWVCENKSSWRKKRKRPKRASFIVLARSVDERVVSEGAGGDSRSVYANLFVYFLSSFFLFAGIWSVHAI